MKPRIVVKLDQVTILIPPDEMMSKVMWIPKGSYFSDCPRDDQGHCTGEGGGSGGGSGDYKPPDTGHVADVVLSEVDGADHPEVKEKARGLVSRMCEKAFHLAIQATPAMMGLIPDILDTPDDFAKIGFNPGMAGVGPRIADPVSEATGLSTHLACSIATKVLSKAIVWAKSKLTEGKAEDQPDFEGAAAWLAKLYDHAYEAIGHPDRSDPEEIEKALRRLYADRNLSTNC